MNKRRKWHRAAIELNLRCIPLYIWPSYGPSWPKAWPNLSPLARLEILAAIGRTGEQISLYLYPALASSFARRFEADLADYWTKAISTRDLTELQRIRTLVVDWRVSHPAATHDTMLGAALFQKTLEVETANTKPALVRAIHDAFTICLNADTGKFVDAVRTEMRHISAPSLVPR